MNEEDGISDIKVVIASFTTMDAPLILSIENHNFELQTIVGVRFITNIKWDGTICSRHCGSQFTSWWVQDRNDQCSIELTEMPEIFLMIISTQLYMFEWKMLKTDKMRNEFLKNLGGLSHV